MCPPGSGPIRSALPIMGSAAGRLIERTDGSDLAEWVELRRYLCPVSAGVRPAAPERWLTLICISVSVSGERHRETTAR
jgi:hypothetical protein